MLVNGPVDLLQQCLYGLSQDTALMPHISGAGEAAAGRHRHQGPGRTCGGKPVIAPSTEDFAGRGHVLKTWRSPQKAAALTERTAQQLAVMFGLVDPSELPSLQPQTPVR